MSFTVDIIAINTSNNIRTYRITEADESGFVTVMPAVYFVNFPEVVS